MAEQPVRVYEMEAAFAAALPARAASAEPLDARAVWEAIVRFVCELRFGHDAEAAAAVAVPAVQVGFAADRAPAEVDAFVSMVQGERAFHVLIDGCRPSGMVTSGPMPPGPLGPP